MNSQGFTHNITDALLSLYTKIALFLPNFLGAILILLIGYFVARACAVIIAKVLEKIGLDKLSDKIGLRGFLNKAGIDYSLSRVFGMVVQWMIILAFLITAAETLGLERVSATIDSFLLYIPRVIGAAVILIIGLTFSHFIKTSIRGAADGLSLSYARALASAAQGLVILVAVSLCISQLQIQTELLNTVISIFILAIGFAVALSLGLGSRDLSGRIIAGVYARELFKPGQHITINDISGTIVEVGTVKTIVVTEQGQRISLPNETLIKETVCTTP